MPSPTKLKNISGSNANGTNPTAIEEGLNVKSTSTKPPTQAELDAAHKKLQALSSGDAGQVGVPETKTIGRPFPSKPHTIPFRDWMQDKGKTPQKVEFRSNEKRGRIYLANISGIGTFELTNGIKKDTPYELSFIDEKSGDHINKIVEIREVGETQSRKFYCKLNGKYYLLGRTVELDLKSINKYLVRWFDETILPPQDVPVRSDPRSRIYLTKYRGKQIFIIYGLSPDTDYVLHFRNESAGCFARPIINQIVDVLKPAGKKVGTYYLRYFGKFYYTAYSLERLMKDNSLKIPTPRQNVRSRSMLIRQYLEGRAQNPGSLPITINEDGTITLTTLSGGEHIFLKGLGNGVRNGRLDLNEDSKSNIEALIFEENGILNNRYPVRDNGIINLTPKPKFGGKTFFLSEIEQIRNWLGLDKNGNLIADLENIGLEDGLNRVPAFSDRYQAAWWAHRLRMTANTAVSLGHIIHEMWVRNKIPRPEITDYGYSASALDYYFNLKPEARQIPKHKRYKDLFDFLWNAKGHTSLSYLTDAMFVGGAIFPRKRRHFLVQLAQSYEYAKSNPLLANSPNFGDNFSGALDFLVKISKGDVSYRVLFNALIATDKLTSETLRLSTMALSFTINNIDSFKEEIQRISTLPQIKILNGDKKIEAARIEFDQDIFANKDGKPIDNNIRTIIMDILFGTFGRGLILNNDPANFDGLKKYKSIKPKRSELDIYSMAKKAPVFDNAFDAIEWLLNNRAADYCLVFHISYLRYFGKLPLYSVDYNITAGAFDYVLSDTAKVVSDIKKTIKKMPKDVYPTPYRISKAILESRIWERRDADKKLTKNFVYLTVIAAFRLRWEELSNAAMAHVGPDYLATLLKKLGEQVRKDVDIPARLDHENVRRQVAEIKGKERIDNNEVNFLTGLIKEGNREAQTLLINFFEPLIKKIAGRYSMNDAEFKDITQIGMMKLLLLAKRYDPQRGLKFITYAWSSLGWYLYTEHLRSTGEDNIHKPARFVEEMNLIRRVKSDLAQELGREPAREELAQVLEIDVEELELKFRLSMGTISIETPISSGSATTFKDVLPDSRPSSERNVLAKEIRETLEQAIEGTRSLTEKEKFVLRTRYLGEKMQTLEEIGKKIKRTRERVRQIEAKAICKIRKGRYANALKVLGGYTDPEPRPSSTGKNEKGFATVDTLLAPYYIAKKCADMTLRIGSAIPETLVSSMRGGLVFLLGDIGSELMRGNVDYLKRLSTRKLLTNYAMLTAGGGVGSLTVKRLLSTPILKSSPDFLKAVLGRGIPLFTALSAVEIGDRGTIDFSRMPLSMANIMTASTIVHGATSLFGEYEWLKRLAKGLRLINNLSKATFLGAAVSSIVEFAIIKTLSEVEFEIAERRQLYEVKKRLADLIERDQELLKAMQFGLEDIPVSEILKVEQEMTANLAVIKAYASAAEEGVKAEYRQKRKEEEVQYLAAYTRPLNGSWTRAELEAVYKERLGKLSADEREALANNSKEASEAESKYEPLSVDPIAKKMPDDYYEISEYGPVLTLPVATLPTDADSFEEDANVSLFADNWHALSNQFEQYINDRNELLIGLIKTMDELAHEEPLLVSASSTFF